MVIAVTDMPPEHLPALVAHIIAVPNSTGQRTDIAKYLAPCGRVQVQLNGVLHLVPLPPV